MMENPEQRVGVLYDGAPRYPAKTLDGRDYYLPPATVHFIGSNRFVVLDGIPPRYDVARGVAELEAALAPPAAPEPVTGEEVHDSPDA